MAAPAAIHRALTPAQIMKRLALAQVLAVVNIDSPTELGSIAGANAGECRLVTQAVAGANEWTLYAWDSASSAGASSPYRVNGTSGQWQAVAGKYTNGAANIAAALTVRAAAGVTSLQAATQDAVALIGRAGGTSSYIATITPAALTGSYSYTLPATAANDTLATLGTVQTFSGAKTFSTILTVDRSGGLAGLYLKADDAQSAELGFYNRTGVGIGLVRPSGGTSLTAYGTAAATTILTLTNAAIGSGALSIGYTTPSTNTATGALTVAGGLGVAGACYVGGVFRVTDVTDSSTVATGSVVLSGGLGIAKNFSLKAQVNAFPGASTAFELCNRSASGGIDFYTNAAGVLALRLNSDGSMSTAKGIAAGESITVGTTDATAFMQPGGTNTHLSLAAMGSAGTVRIYAMGVANGTVSNVLRGTFNSSGLAVVGAVAASGALSGTSITASSKIATACSLADDGLAVANTSATGWGASIIGGNATNYSLVVKDYLATEVLKVLKTTTATHTALMLWDVDNATLERVTVGAADSGGAGFKVLRIPN